MRVLSWNILRRTGATPNHILNLLNLYTPDIALFQEASADLLLVQKRLGGHISCSPFHNRPDGLVVWSNISAKIIPIDLEYALHPSKQTLKRLAVIIETPYGTLANVHLAHDQSLNRRQLAQVFSATSGRTAVIGDTNMVGPLQTIPKKSFAGIRDAGPKTWTHLAKGIFPFRLDRCLCRDWPVTKAMALPRGHSDHRPIIIDLESTL